MEGAGWSWRSPKSYVPCDPQNLFRAVDSDMWVFCPVPRGCPCWDGATVQAELGNTQGSDAELPHTFGFPGPSGCGLRPRPTLAGGGAVGCYPGSGLMRGDAWGPLQSLGSFPAGEELAGAGEVVQALQVEA